MLADIELVAFHVSPVPCRRLLNLIAQPRNAPDSVERRLEAIDIVQHDHVERRRRGALVAVTADVDIVMVMPPVGQLVNHRGLAVEGENHRPVGGEPPGHGDAPIAAAAPSDRPR
jgi:hypothetical protein